jgi:prepilin-type N-terminal cleavage/methylation domain-containing protein
MSAARRAPGGFTLLELMISTAIAVAIATMMSTAFFQTRTAITRAQARLALADEARAIYMALAASITSAQQSCAVVAIAVQRNGAAAPDPGTVSLIFMRGNDDKDNFGATSYDSSQIVWEEWQWRRATGTIHAGTNRAIQDDARQFSVASTFRPNGGVDYKGKAFVNVPQPRRQLDPADPVGSPVLAGPAASRLDDNQWFPDPANPGQSLVSIEDLGDYGDLQKAIAAPAFDRVTDFAFQIASHDESLPIVAVDDSIAATTVWQGVWLDGRLGAGADRTNATLAPPQVFPGSDGARRPKLLRLRFTLVEPRSKVTQTFSFSFAWPGMARDH